MRLTIKNREERKKSEKRSKYLYITITSNCINDKIITLLYLSNSFARRRRREIIIINNNIIIRAN